MNQQFDVLVVGGGIVGLTAALAMAERDYSVAIIDSGPLTLDECHPNLRVYAINQASQFLLTELGIWQRLDLDRISSYSQMHVWDAINGAHIDFDSRFIAAKSLGAIVEEQMLKHALLEQIFVQPGISLFPNSIVDNVRSEEHNITVFSQDIAWEGQLLMIADGANSPARQKLKVDLTRWSYNQQAVVATVNTEKPHLHTAYQVFNSDGPLAFLPLASMHQCSIVWSTNPSLAQKLMGLSDQDFSVELTKAFAAKLGEVNVASVRHQFPLEMRHVKQYTGNRWLLLGDAAHTIHPLAGLGLNVGLADVRSWINCMDKTNITLCSKKALGAYQRERKHAVWQIILLMEGLKRLFSQSALPLVSLRGLGLRLCNEITPIKRLFIQHAAG